MKKRMMRWIAMRTPHWLAEIIYCNSFGHEWVDGICKICGIEKPESNHPVEPPARPIETDMTLTLVCNPEETHAFSQSIWPKNIAMSMAVGPTSTDYICNIDAETFGQGTSQITVTWGNAVVLTPPIIFTLLKDGKKYEFSFPELENGTVKGIEVK